MTENKPKNTDSPPKSMVTFQKLAQSPAFVQMLQHADKIGLDQKHISKQIQNMADAGYTLEAMHEWLGNIVTSATREVEKQMRAQAGNQGMPFSPEQLAGQQPRYSESNMAPGTYLAMKPNVHVATQVEIILITFSELMAACLEDPKGVNPYNYRLISLNRFLDRISEKQYFTEAGVPKEMPTGKMEEIETVDETTGKPVKSQIPETVPSPHYSLIQKKKKAEELKKYEEFDMISGAIPKWFMDDEIKVNDIEMNHFSENLAIIRKNFQAVLRDMAKFQYADVRQANTIHHASQLPADPVDKSLRKREYEANQVVLNGKGSAFLRMYFYCWNQADQRGIYGNFIMMGLDKNLTW